MLVAGLTGGLGCGKSFVGQAFADLGCRVVEADRLGRELILRGGECFDAIVQEFGSSILAESGEIDRARLAGFVFSDAAKLRRLNAIVHPAVRRKSLDLFRAIGRQEPTAVVIYVAAILVEIGSARDFDKLIVVHCTPEQQLARSIERGASEEDVRARIAHQLPPAKKLEAADYIIDAGGSKEETLRQTKMVYQRLRELAI